MSRRFFSVSMIIFTIGLYYIFCSTSQNEKSLKTNVDQQELIYVLEETIPVLLEDTMIPGLSIAVVRDGSLLCSSFSPLRPNRKN